MPKPGDYIPPPRKKLGRCFPLFAFVEAEIKDDYTRLDTKALTEFMAARYNGTDLAIEDKLVGLRQPLLGDAENFYKACVFLFQDDGLGLAEYHLLSIVNREALFEREPELCRAVCRRFSDLKDEEYYELACQFHENNSVGSALAHATAIRIPHRFKGLEPSIERIIERHDRVMMHKASAAFRIGLKEQGQDLLSRTYRPVRAYPEAGPLTRLAPYRFEQPNNAPGN